MNLHKMMVALNSFVFETPDLQYYTIDSLFWRIVSQSLCWDRAPQEEHSDFNSVPVPAVERIPKSEIVLLQGNV